MVVPLDEYPLHQVPLSMEHVGSSDRNFYDRYYFNAHDRTGELFLITGFGVYANLGVSDAFATLRKGDEQITVRMSDALDHGNRLAPSVGPYRIEVIEPLHKLRLVSDTDDHGLAIDLTWEGSFPAVDEEPHVVRTATGRIMLDAQRFAQVGTWEGVIRLGGEEITVSPDTWVGTRDRSWGIRPVGESEPAGRAAAEADPNFGFWWLYVPLRFEDHSLIVIVQERADGTRVLNDAKRVWAPETGRGVEQLGWPEFDIRYRSGTRHPEGATITLSPRTGKPFDLEIETLGFAALAAGPGYGADPHWSHGQWKGRGWVEGGTVDLTDPTVAGMIPYMTIDHVARATAEGQEGWGLFEHASIGRHDPTGFEDFTSVAP
jgi:hypothetical protein